MNRLFGSKPTGPKPSLSGAIKNLDERVDSLDVKIAKLNAELSAIQQRVANMRDGPGKTALKKKALNVLQRRKQIEAQKDQIQQQSWNMEQASMMQDNLKSGFISISLIFGGVVLCLPLSFLEVYIPRMLWVLVKGNMREEFGAMGTGRIEEEWEGFLGWVMVWGWIAACLCAVVGLGVLFFRALKLIVSRLLGRSTDVMVTVDALKTTNKELKKQYGKIDIDKIEQLQDEMADLMDIGNEINESISRAYDIPDDVDEEELDAEFEALAGEMELENDMAGLEGVPSYLQPEVPEFVDAPVEEGKGKEAEKALQ